MWPIDPAGDREAGLCRGDVPSGYLRQIRRLDSIDDLAFVIERKAPSVCFGLRDLYCG